MQPTKFSLEQQVRITCSGEAGVVIGRGLSAAEHVALRGAADAIADGAAALEACRARGIVVEQWAGDEHGNLWRATVQHRGRATGQPPLVHLLATTADEAARMALRYIGARGWQQS